VVYRACSTALCSAVQCSVVQCVAQCSAVLSFLLVPTLQCPPTHHLSALWLLQWPHSRTPQKVKMLSSRLNEYRVKAAEFEREVKRARAALRKEVGPKADLERVVDEGSNWRGRAQKIVMLKAKVKQLQEQVNEHSTKADVDSRARAEIQVRV